MIDFKFFLNDDLEIEEPIGFNDIQLSLIRDDKTHGMQFEASTTSMQFYGEAADYLREKRRMYGVKSEVIFIAQSRCNEEADYEEILRGRLNFCLYQEKRGSQCIITLPIESDTCELVLKNRFDQKVNIDNALGFDGATVLQGYNGLSVTKQLKPKSLFVASSAQVNDEDLPVNFTINLLGEDKTIVRPSYSTIIYDSIDTGNFYPSSQWESSRYTSDFPISPQLLFEEIIDCFNDNVNYRFVFKGPFSISKESAGGGNVVLNSIKIKIFQWNAVGNIFTNGVLIREATVFSGLVIINTGVPYTGTLNYDLTGTMPVSDGIGIYGVVEVDTTTLGEVAQFIKFFFDFSNDTKFEITGNKACPATNVELSLLHETLSRAVEAITDGCIRVKSSYYGRIDSEPFAFNADGCGGLRFLTSGLKIRKAIEDNFFASVKELIEGLQAIDNVGMGVEIDPDSPGRFALRIEALDFFYQDTELLFHDYIPDVNDQTDESKHYSKINVGYKKWEVSKINGLDEYNSTREYRTDISSVSNTLEITSNLVAGGYPIEVTRQQSFADTGGADTTYDNETFILTAVRDAYGIEPEQGNIENPENIYSPDTAWNWKLSPIRNLMRWYKSIINSYASIADSGNKLYFNAGTGNLVARGTITPGSISDDCIIENQDISENQNLFITQFAKAPEYTPLYKNEIVTYEYPMSISDYRTIKETPYGYIKYQCGNGAIEKGFIKEIKYKLVDGMASVTLKKKW